MNVQAAIFNKLKTDATLQGLLAAYDGKPAIFTAAPAPRNAVMPFIIMEGAVSDVPEDDFTDEGRNSLHDVRVYTKATGLPTVIENIVERVRTLLHRQSITVSGWANLLTRVDNVQTGPTEPDVYARVITVRTIFEKE